MDLPASFSTATGRITIAFGGDVNLGRRSHYLHAERSPLDQQRTTSAFSLLKSADLGIVNLECVVGVEGELGLDKGEQASYYFRARPEQLRLLVDAGVDFVATANNHSGDYGRAALLEQNRLLDAVGIAQAGSGGNSITAMHPALRRAGGLNVALFAFDTTQPQFAATDLLAGHAYLDPEQVDEWSVRLKQTFSAIRQVADLILVAVHWGANNLSEPGARKTAMGHAFIDAGADAVLGSSAHMLQGIEIYRRRPIIHDAGDFFFDSLGRTNRDSGVFVLEADGSGIARVSFHPVILGACRSELATGKMATNIARRFSRQCEVMGTLLQVNADGVGHVNLDPPLRPLRTGLPPANITQYNLDALRPLPAPRPEWLVPEVPPASRLEKPIRVGPLVLLGLEVQPAVLRTRGSLFVTSYWTLLVPTKDDWRIEFQAVPQREGDSEVKGVLGNWGLSSDHDPCDWMWPTSRWQKGQIYRDTYALRPSRIRRWVDAQLHLMVRVRRKRDRLPWQLLMQHIPFALSHKEAFAVMRANIPHYRVVKPTPDASMPEGGLWTSSQLTEVTRGRWLVEPPPGWAAASVSNKAGFLQTPEYPRPRLYVATDNRIASWHELVADTMTRNWDTHVRLPALADKFDGAIVSRPVPGLPPDFPLLQVSDPFQALIELGIAARQRLQGKVVAVTGSAGKTSLSCMLNDAMAADCSVVTNAKINYNSRCGLMHLLANTPETTALVVMEVAVSAINAPRFQNIKLLRPDIAVITNIGPSHLPPGKGLDYVARRKGNIIEGLSDDGVLLLFREMAFFGEIRERALKRGIRVLSYGQSDDSDMRLLQYDAPSNRVVARLPDGTEVEYTLSAPGLHMAINSLACVAVRQLLDMPLEPWLPALARFQPEAGRGQRFTIPYKDGSVEVVDESYNANPLSMRAALAALRAEAGGKRRVVILGDMLELGDDALRHHQELAEPVAAVEPACVLLCGSLMRELPKRLLTLPAAPNCFWYANVQALQRDLAKWIQAGDQVLIKGSNSIGLGELVDALREAGAS